MKPETYDIGIIGAGCAGLSLTHELINQFGTDLRIALFDPNLLQHPQKTWSLWTKEPERYQTIAEGVWKRMAFADRRGLITEQISPYSYVSIPACRYRQHILNQLVDLPNVLLHPVASERYGHNGQDFLVKTEKQAIHCNKLFSSVYQPAGQGRYALAQHFLGWFLETSRPIFDPETVLLMDFRTQAEKDAVEFVYLLPYSPTRALVEYTVFSRQPWPVEQYRKKLKLYLENQGIDSYAIESTEQGVIPMTDYAFPQHTPEGLHHIGVAGGLVRPATGYAFRFIEQDSALIAASLHQQSVRRLIASRRHQFYDRLLLHLIDRYPERVPVIMSTLFRRNRFPEILSFLDRSSKLTEEVSIFTKLPWFPFLRALYETIIRS